MEAYQEVPLSIENKRIENRGQEVEHVKKPASDMDAKQTCCPRSGDTTDRECKAGLRKYWDILSPCQLYSSAQYRTFPETRY